MRCVAPPRAGRAVRDLVGTDDVVTHGSACRRGDYCVLVVVENNPPTHRETFWKLFHPANALIWFVNLFSFLNLPVGVSGVYTVHRHAWPGHVTNAREGSTELEGI